ncbi:MAG TPA: molybdate ABC transporter substrate-binding protein [Gemmataceae bacterium]|nr:molybdate ABC transporter substrate-binding protein [Gemmataceae bacterium]
MTTVDQQWMRDWRVGVRLWVERCGEAILGPGRLELLEAIDRCHSISAAARALGMSYRRAWLLVESVNRAAGEELVHRQTGGRQGGGAELTTRGHDAIRIYRELQARVELSAALPPRRQHLSPAAHPAVVRVAAAASLENVLDYMLADFAMQQPAVSVRAICGASDELADQILNGVHVDLFLSAADEPLDWLGAAGVLAPKSRAVLSSNRLAAIAGASRIANVLGPQGLLQAAVQSIALADPCCPLGHYTRTYLEPLGLWNAIRERAHFLDNPRVVLAAVESGQADVGLVYHSDACTARACRILFTTGVNQPAIRYTAVLTRRGEQSASARGLLAFLTSSPAHRLLQRFGFLIPSAKRSRPRS